MEKKKVSAMQKSNLTTLGGYGAIGLVLLVTYFIELAKGNRTIGYIAVFALIVAIPITLCIMAYAKNKESLYVKYIFLIGYIVMYLFVIFTTDQAVAFVYIIPAFVLVIPYCDMIIAYSLCGLSVAANAVQIVIKALDTGLSKEEVVFAEIQIAILLVTGVLAAIATRISKVVNEAKLSEINEEKENTTKMLNTILEVSEGITKDIVEVNEKMSYLDMSVASTKNSMEDVSAGTVETAESIQEQLLKTEEIGEYIGSVKSVSAKISEDIAETSKSLSVGTQNIDLLLEQVNNSEKASADVVKRMDELQENTNQMHSIVDLISSVTSQTSLLALNASIEAARAGEAGKGFAVVATEISNLAKQTSDATESITKLIYSIADSLNEVVSSISQLVESNKEQNVAANQTAESFTVIKKNSQSVNTLSAELEKVIANLAVANEVIVDRINNISAITEEVSARTSETFSASEKDSIIVSEVTELVNALNLKAQELTK